MNTDLTDFLGNLKDGNDEPITPSRRRASRPLPPLQTELKNTPSDDDDVSLDLEDEEEDAAELAEPAEPKPKRPAKSKKREREAAAVVSAISSLMPTTDDESDGSDDGPRLPEEFPKPTDATRSLGSLMSKFRIGEESGFKVQLYRLNPKWHKGTKLDGYIEEYSEPISEQLVAEEYMGGEYQAKITGPDPRTGTGSRIYETFKFSISGEPNPSRLPRSAQAAMAKAAVPAPAPTAAPAISSEPPTLVLRALEVVEKQALSERQDRIAITEQMRKNESQQHAATAPLLDAERRHSEDMMKAERERSALREKHLEEALADARRETQKIAERLETMAATPAVSVVDEFGKMLALLPKSDGDASARSTESITKSILDRHQTETEAMHKQHASMIDAMRTAHQNEITSMREAGRRELDAEREASRSREQRHEEALKVEREERRRDHEAAQRAANDRDATWRDRLEQQEINLKTTWESRCETMKSNYESQITWLKSENDQLVGRNRDLDAKLADKNDVFKTLAGLRDMKGVVKDAFDLTDASSGGGGGGVGGIGLEPPASSGGIDWGEIVREAVGALPTVREMLQGQPQVQPQQQQQQRPPQPGDIVPTAQGLMVVISTPQGLALTPKAQFDAAQAQQNQQTQQTQRVSHPGQPRPRGVFAAPPQQRPVSDGIPVPDMSVGLPRPRPWGEAVQPPLPPAAPPTQASPRQETQVVSSPRPPQGASMSPTELFIAGQVAKLVHESVSAGEEPQDFVNKVLGSGYPRMAIDAIVKMSDDQVITAIRAVQPNSAGATAAGHRFVRGAMAILRKSA